jgi:HPt (histidine-containing phosphotransfer) domain-containing protein
VQGLAHTLKGAAATLSARPVAEAAGRIESAARHGADIAAELPAFERAWAELAQARLPDPTATAAAAPAIPAAAALAPERALSELGEALSGNSLSAGARFRALRALLDGHGVDGRLHELGRRIEGLEFEAARLELEALRLQLAAGAS